MANSIEMQDGKFLIDGKLYTFAEIRRAVRFWREYHFNKGDTECPICGSDLWAQGLFVCEECGTLKWRDDESPYEDRVCRDCDETYQEEKAYEDAVNLEIDKRNGK